ncbi:hypothetical protein A9995_09015 [Erythrobacter sp. QSSC1-22B]|nr:hypothetical protein A9995_09015 [Erythrobacter sp. QSSC1-22B]
MCLIAVGIKTVPCTQLRRRPRVRFKHFSDVFPIVAQRRQRIAQLGSGLRPLIETRLDQSDCSLMLVAAGAYQVRVQVR